jgi:hypothetical protein
MRVVDCTLWPLGLLETYCEKNARSGVISAPADQNMDDGSIDIEVRDFVENFGVGEIRTFTQHFAGLLKIKMNDDGVSDDAMLVSMMMGDWQSFKADIVKGDIGILKLKNESHSEFWNFMRQHYKDRYPCLLWLVLIIRLVPIGSAECERMFSLMNRLKTDLRNRMKNARLNELMTVNRLAPSLKDLTDSNLDQWISHWDAECKRRRYTSYFK